MGESSKENPENNSVSFLSYLKGLMPLSNNSFKKGIKKVEDRYVLPHELVKEYLSEHKELRKALDFSFSTFNEYFPTNNEIVRTISHEFIKAKAASQKSEYNYSAYCGHLYKIIEFIDEQFWSYNPGWSKIENWLNEPSTSDKSKKIKDILLGKNATAAANKKKVKGDNRSLDKLYEQGMEYFLTLNKYGKPNIGLESKDYIFRHFVLFDQDLKKYKVLKKPEFHSDMLDLMRYHRHFNAHLIKNLDPPRETEFNKEYILNPTLIVSTNEAEKVVLAYCYLYGEFLKCQVTK